MFMMIAHKLAANSKYWHDIINVAHKIDAYAQRGKDPVEALDFLLGLYSETPKRQAEIRKVITGALAEWKHSCK